MVMMMMAWNGDNDDDGRGAVVVAVAVAVSMVFLFCVSWRPSPTKKPRFLHMAADATQPSLPQSSSHQHALRRRSPRRRCAPQAGVG